MTTINLDLDPFVISHLDELAAAGGTTRERILTTLIEQAYQARPHVLSDDAEWEITLNAKEDVLRLLRRPATPENLDYADNMLHAACIDAADAERRGGRKPVPMSSGALRYRGPKPQRLSLFVVNGALVRVTQGPERS